MKLELGLVKPRARASEKFLHIPGSVAVLDDDRQPTGEHLGWPMDECGDFVQYDQEDDTVYFTYGRIGGIALTPAAKVGDLIAFERTAHGNGVYRWCPGENWLGHTAMIGHGYPMPEVLDPDAEGIHT